MSGAPRKSGRISAAKLKVMYYRPSNLAARRGSSRIVFPTFERSQEKVEKPRAASRGFFPSLRTIHGAAAMISGYAQRLPMSVLPAAESFIGAWRPCRSPVGVGNSVLPASAGPDAWGSGDSIHLPGWAIYQFEFVGWSA